jgi:hypothetical protein
VQGGGEGVGKSQTAQHLNFFAEHSLTAAPASATQRGVVATAAACARSKSIQQGIQLKE